MNNLELLVLAIWERIKMKTINYSGAIEFDMDFDQLHSLLNEIGSQYKTEALDFYYDEETEYIHIYFANSHSNDICKIKGYILLNGEEDNIKTLHPYFLISNFGYIYYNCPFVKTKVIDFKFDENLDLFVIEEGFVVGYEDDQEGDGHLLWRTKFDTTDEVYTFVTGCPRMQMCYEDSDPLMVHDYADMILYIFDKEKGNYIRDCYLYDK